MTIRSPDTSRTDEISWSGACSRPEGKAWLPEYQSAGRGVVPRARRADQGCIALTGTIASPIGCIVGAVADWVSSDTHRIQVQVLRFVDQLP